MRVAVTGTSGLLGAALVRALLANGHEVLRLVRRRPESPDEALWYPAVDTERLRDVDAVIHLVGETLVGRWTQHQREAIRESRVYGTKLLARALADMPDGPKVFLCASATGYYGDRGPTPLTEDQPPGKGFLPSVYMDAEAAAKPAVEAGLRVARLRFGVLHSTEGGALPLLLPVFRRGLGFTAGKGDQWVSWITLSDAVRAVRYVLDSTLAGAVNVVAPNPITSREYADTLASVLSRPRFLALPPSLIRWAYGTGLADEVMLASTRVLPERLLAAGFEFENPTFRETLQRLLLRVT